MAEIFALIGDQFHNADYIKISLNKTIQQGIKHNIDYTIDTHDLSAETINRYKLLILYRDGFDCPEGYLNEFDGIAVTHYGGYEQAAGTKNISIPAVPQTDKKFIPWMTATQGKAIKNYVNDGGGILFLHNSSHLSLTNDDCRDVQGGAFLGHPPVRPFRVKITNHNHPITKGVNDFVITDEQHFVIFDKNPNNVFMENENEDGLSFTCPNHGHLGTRSPAGWAYEFGKGKVCFMSPGHTIDANWNPEYVKLMQNAVQWLANFKKD